MSSSGDVSPSPTPSTTPLSGTHAPKFGTVVPNRIFVGGIAANTTEAELKAFFTAYGAVKDTKIIADRAGVSKGYGFVTFETQEDAEKIIKKEADNLVFKDRKLNIGPAIRKQAFPRSYDPNMSPGTILFTNGVPYTYQNGMAVFPASEGSYPVPQPQQQPYSTMVVPQPQAVYMAPTQQYQPYQHTASTPQWSSPSGQWRWAPQVGDYKIIPYSPSPTAVTGSPGYMTYPTVHTATELMYAQPPPQAYQQELAEAGVLEGTPVEGGVYTVDHALGSRYYPADVHHAIDQSGQRTLATAVYPYPQHAKPTIQYKKPAMTVIPSHSLSADSFMMTPPNKVQIISKPGHMIQRSPSTMAKPSDCGDGSGPLTPPSTPIGK